MSPGAACQGRNGEKKRKSSSRLKKWALFFVSAGSCVAGGGSNAREKYDAPTGSTAQFWDL